MKGRLIPAPVPQKLQVVFLGWIDKQNLGDDLLTWALAHRLHRWATDRSLDITFGVELDTHHLHALSLPLPEGVRPWINPIRAKYQSLKHQLPRPCYLMWRMVVWAWAFFNVFLYRLKMPVFNRDLIQSLQSMDMLYFQGGGYIRKPRRSFSFFHLFNTLFVVLTRWANPNVYVAASGQGFGPFLADKALDVQVMNYLVRQMDSIGVRERESLQWCQGRISPEIPRACVGDDVLALYSHLPQRVSKSSLPHLALNIKWIEGGLSPQLERAFVRLIEAFQAQTGGTVGFYSFGEDEQYLEQVSHPVLKALPVYSPYAMGWNPFIHQLNQATAAVGFAYHFAILAQLMNIPCLAVYKSSYFQQKIQGVLQWTGEPHWVVSMEAFMAMDPSEVFAELAQMPPVNSAHMAQLAQQQEETYGQWWDEYFHLEPPAAQAKTKGQSQDFAVPW